MSMRLTFIVVLAFFGHAWASAQALSFRVLSPTEIEGAMPFSWAQPADGWSTPDFTFGGSITGELVLANDGGTGLNPQGNPVSGHACNPLINDVQGKIAVVFRNDCIYAQKALNAQNAGAIGVVIINNTTGTTELGAGELGNQVFIPVVMVSLEDGATLTTAMLNGPVNIFFGSKVGLYTSDFGFVGCAFPLGKSYPTLLLDAQGQRYTPLQAEVFNYGTLEQSATVTVTITKDGQTLYTASQTQAVGAFAVSQVVYFFPDFSNYQGTGEYQLTYTLTPEQPDEDPIDNSFSTPFVVNANDIFAYAQSDPQTALPLAPDTYYGSTFGEFQTCLHFVNPNADNKAVEGMYFSAVTPSGVSIAGKSIDIAAHALLEGSNPIDFGVEFAEYFFASGSYTFNESDSQALIYVPFSQPVEVNASTRYLFCVAKTDPDLYIGYETSPESDYFQTIVANYEVTSPVLFEGQWYVGGYGYDVVPNIALQLGDAPLEASLFVQNQLDCPGVCTGEIFLVANQPNLNITWYNNGNAIPFANGLALSNACEGTYYAVVSNGTESYTTNEVTLQAPVSVLVSSVTAPLSVQCGSSADIFLNISTTNSQVQNTPVPYTLELSVLPGSVDCDYFGNSLTDVEFAFAQSGVVIDAFAIGGAATNIFDYMINGTILPDESISLAGGNLDYTQFDPAIENCAFPIEFLLTLTIDGQIAVQEVLSTNPNQFEEVFNYSYSINSSGTVDIIWSDPIPQLVDESTYHYSAYTNAATDFSVVIEYTDGCGNVQSDQHDFTIEAPTNFGLAVLTNPTAGPTPFNAVFNNQTPGLSAYEFEWDFGDGNSEVNNSPFVTHTYSTGGIWDVTLTATEPSTGCQETLVLEDYILSIGDGCLNPGCQDSEACNYDATADCDDGSCVYPEAFFDCLGECLNDLDNDGVCDQFEIVGCTNTNACNYNPEATDDNGECLIVGTACNDGNENTINDVIGDDCSCQGTLFLLGCTNTNACNYNPNATNNDGSCVFPPDASVSGSVVVSDFSESSYTAPMYSGATYMWSIDNGVIQSGQSTSMISVFWAAQGLGQVCVTITVSECPSSESCTNIVITPGNDVAGCTDATACNFDAAATLDDGNCDYIGDVCNDGDGSTINDVITADCTCAGTSTTIFGCTVSSACNYDPLATADDASCFFVGDSCDDANPDTVNDSIQTDCSCSGEVVEIAGCTDMDACNYNPAAIIDDGSCEYVIQGLITGDVLPAAFTDYSYSYPFTAGSIYQWDAQNGIVTTGQGSPTVTVFWGAEGSGSLSVQETNASDCVGTAVELDVIVTPVNVQTAVAEEVRVFPVPTDNVLWVKGCAQNSRYYLYNALGACVLTGSATGDFSIATASISSGTYLLQIIGTQHVSTHRIEVVH